MSTDIERLRLIAERIYTTKKDITATYDDWFHITAACASLGEEAREPYHLICSNYPGYKREECDQKFDNCLHSANGSITFGTLLKMAQDAGVDTTMPMIVTQPTTTMAVPAPTTPLGDEGMTDDWADPDEYWRSLPRKFPPFVLMIINHFPPELRTLAFFVVLTIMGVYGGWARARMHDNEEHFPGLLVIGVGISSVGKNVLAVLKKLLTPILQEIAAKGRLAEEQWELAKKNYKEGEPLPVKPDMYVPLITLAKSSDSQLHNRIMNAKGRPLLDIITEGGKILKHAGSAHLDLRDALLNGYDGGSDIVDYKVESTQRGEAPFFLSIAYTLTPDDICDIFDKRHVRRGYSTRAFFVPVNGIKRRAEEYDRLHKPFTEEDKSEIEFVCRQLLQPANDKIIELPRTKKRINSWFNDNLERHLASDPDNEALFDFSKRARAYALRIALICYLLMKVKNPEYEEDEYTFGPALYAIDYYFKGQLKLFGDIWNEQYKKPLIHGRVYETPAQDLLSELGDEFMFKELEEKRAEKGLSTQYYAVMKQISNLKSAKLIKPKKNCKGVYINLYKRKKKK